MKRQIIAVDCETNGRNVERHQAIEVAWWNLDTDERGLFIPPHAPSAVLGAAEVEALRVNRYIDRIPGQPQDYNGHRLLELHAQFSDYDEDDVCDTETGPAATEVRHTLLAANPAFDAKFLTKLFASLDDFDPEPWHYRLLDIEAYAMAALQLDHVPGMREICDLLEIASPDHAADVDVTALGTAWRRLQDPSAVQGARGRAYVRGLDGGLKGGAA